MKSVFDSTCFYAPLQIPFSLIQASVRFLPLFGISAHSPRVAVVLFVSDMHFGRSTSPRTEREAESDLVDCLRAHRDRLTHLYLVGDVFDAYIEYPTLVPKGFVRFQAEIASLTDAGVPVTYLLGNHDPWHRDYFASELGVTVVPNYCTRTHALADPAADSTADPAAAPAVNSTKAPSVRVFCAHGDEQAGAAGGRTKRFRPILRHPACVWLYRNVFPGDLGFRLARRVSRGIHDRSVNPDLVRALDNDARARLAETDADLVVMGHTHASRLHTYPGGVYLNTGAWRHERTFARLTASGIHLARWNGSHAQVIEATDLPVSTRPTTAS